MPVSITIAKLKSELYLKIAVATFDADLTTLIADVVTQAVDYLDDEDIVGQATLPDVLERPLLKQMSYEWRRRKDPGLSSVSYPDGNVNKYFVDEWLDDVKPVLDRHRNIATI